MYIIFIVQNHLIIRPIIATDEFHTIGMCIFYVLMYLIKCVK